MLILLGEVFRKDRKSSPVIGTGACSEERGEAEDIVAEESEVGDRQSLLFGGGGGLERSNLFSFGLEM